MMNVSRTDTTLHGSLTVFPTKFGRRAELTRGEMCSDIGIWRQLVGRVLVNGRESPFLTVFQTV